MIKKRINDLEIENAELRRQLQAHGPTLRDQFAMAAFTGMFARFGPTGWNCKDCYKWADRMMEERNNDES